MLDSYKEFLSLSETERKDIFEIMAEELGTIPSYIEKDFWVCLTLGILFNELPPDHPRLLFKGGTSLSKVYGLINRFSEDIDITVFREDLGFSEDKDPSSQKISGGKRKKLIPELVKTASEYIQGHMSAALIPIFESLDDKVRIVGDDNDPDKSTLLVEYSTLFPIAEEPYVSPRVKIESGARSAFEPNSSKEIEPYIAEQLKGYDLRLTNIRTIAAERTFWDKVFILYEIRKKFEKDGIPPSDQNRLSRHYYDVMCILNSRTGKGAINDQNLRENVLEHRKIFFRSGWADYDNARPPNLLITPEGDLLQSLERDYKAMSGMILGDEPKFEEIVEVLNHFEKKLNSQ